MRPILLIAYDFAPEISGVRRTAKYLEYLPQFGWEPTLLTTTPFSATGYDLAPLIRAQEAGREIIRVAPKGLFHQRHQVEIDEGILDKERAKLKQNAPLDLDKIAAAFTSLATDDHSVKASQQRPGWLRSLASLYRGWFTFPDERAGWNKPATGAAKEWLSDHSGAPYLSTSYPHSCHLIGLALKRDERFHNHCWIADFRDGWTQNADTIQAPTEARQRRHAEAERDVARGADLLLTASSPITEHLEKVGERSKRGRQSLTILNGYDGKDLDQALQDSDEIKKGGFWPGDKFVITYAGTLFGRRAGAPLFEGIKELIEREPRWKSKLAVHLLTRLRPEEALLIKELGLNEIVKVLGMLPHREALALQAASGALLLTIAPGPKADIMMTQKVFEYLGTGLPIIANVPYGACRDLLQGRPQVFFAEPGNASSLAEAIIAAGDFQNDRPSEPDAELSRVAQIKKMADALDEVVAGS